MRTLIKFMLAFALAGVTVDLTNPGFFASLYEGIYSHNLSARPYKQAMPETKANVGITRRPLRYREGIEKLTLREVTPKNEIIAPENVPNTLWSNSYKASTQYSKDAYTVAEKYTVGELKMLTANYRKRYHQAIYGGMPRARVKKVYREYVILRDALAIKTQ